MGVPLVLAAVVVGILMMYYFAKGELLYGNLDVDQGKNNMDSHKYEILKVLNELKESKAIDDNEFEYRKSIILKK